MSELEIDVRVVLVFAGLMFLWALVLGQVKYRQIVVSAESQAHPYTDIAHRAALMYSFALILIAVFTALSAWSTTVDLIAAGVLMFYFVISVASYMVHGLRRDTTNQLAGAPPSMGFFMASLVVGEIGGFLVLFSGFLVQQF